MIEFLYSYGILDYWRREIGQVEPGQDLDTSVLGIDVEIAWRVGHQRVVDLFRVLVVIDRYGISSVEAKPDDVLLFNLVMISFELLL